MLNKNATMLICMALAAAQQACGTQTQKEDQRQASATAGGTSKDVTPDSTRKGSLALAMPVQDKSRPYQRIEISLTQYCGQPYQYEQPFYGTEGESAGGAIGIGKELPVDASDATSARPGRASDSTPVMGKVDSVDPMPIPEALPYYNGHYESNCAYQSVTQFLASDVGESTQSIDGIPQGSYDIEVKLFGADDEELEYGISTVDVSAGQTSVADVSLSPVNNSGYGSVVVQIHRAGEDSAAVMPPTSIETADGQAPTTTAVAKK